MQEGNLGNCLKSLLDCCRNYKQHYYLSNHCIPHSDYTIYYHHNNLDGSHRDYIYYYQRRNQARYHHLNILYRRRYNQADSSNYCKLFSSIHTILIKFLKAACQLSIHTMIFLKKCYDN